MTSNIQKVKDDLIEEMDRRLVDKIIEKPNADLLKKLIEQSETIHEAIMIAELGTTYKRTGFHFDPRLEPVLTDTIKYFKKNEKLSFVQDKNALTHKLIIGDNYDALLNILIEYRGKIDIIYIDPPYGKDSMGEFAKTNYENAITRDNLLSMLYPRLVLARQLLSDNGVIFCSIDDKNQAYVKGLFDEVFGESGFITSLTRTVGAVSKKVKHINSIHDYVLIYSNSQEFSNNIDISTEHFKYNDERGDYALIHPLDNGGLGYIASLDFEIKLNGKTFIPGQHDNNNERKKFRWTWGKELVKFGLENGLLVERGNRIYIKDYKEFSIQKNKNNQYSIVKKTFGAAYSSTHLIQECYSNRTGTRELNNILPSNSFDNPKPVELIKFCINLLPETKIILDFFAGSGTTGHAVLELNKQDGGKRQFILATANEITDTTPNGIVNDVTSKRLKRVMTGECYDGTKDFKWNEKNKPLGDNLDVYDIATVASYSDEPFMQIDETLYGKEKLGVNEKIKWVCENFEGTQKSLEGK